MLSRSVLFAIGAIVAGCNSSSPPAAVPPPAAPPPAPAAAPVAPAVPAPAVPAPQAAPACSLQGQWSGTINPGPTPFANSPVTADYRADHTTDWGTRLARFTGTWQVEGDVLRLTDTSSTMAGAACPSNQTGSYRLEWAPDCNAVTFRTTEEPCEGRRRALADLRLARSAP